MIDPQTINLSDLPSFPLAWKKALPECSGIYFVINANDEILYIGRSNNIRSRWQQHHRYHQLEQLENVKIAWLELSDNSLLSEIEAALIEWFDPSLNWSEQIKSRQKESFNICLTFTSVPRFIDLSPYWTDDKNLSINKAHEKTGLDKRTLSAAKKGRLDRAQIDTLFRLKDLASELAGRQLMIEDLVRDDVEN